LPGVHAARALVVFVGWSAGGHGGRDRGEEVTAPDLCLFHPDSRVIICAEGREDT
jgi:hypothetical protein